MKFSLFLNDKSQQKNFNVFIHSFHKNIISFFYLVKLVGYIHNLWIGCMTFFN